MNHMRQLKVVVQVYGKIIFTIISVGPFSIAITSLWEERAKHTAFRTFYRLAHVWFCLFHLHLRVWDGLRLVIVALPKLFSYIS